MNAHWSDEELPILHEAFERTMHKLGNPRIKYSDGYREKVARRILRGAALQKCRNLDPEELSAFALTSLGIGCD